MEKKKSTDTVSKKALDQLKITYLTPAQLDVLNGPKWQVIFGAAGTGKTLILQAKVMELLQHGESVTVIVPNQAYVNPWHRRILSECPRADEKFHIKNEPLTQLLSRAMGIPENMFNDGPSGKNASNIVQLIDNFVVDDGGKFWRQREPCIGTGHLIIDDCPKSFTVILFVMTLMERMCPDKVIWIAMDPYENNTPIDYIKKNLQKHQASITILNEVMRCTESVFQYAYKNEGMNWAEKTQPVIGHSVKGEPVVTIKMQCLSLDDALESVWKKMEVLIRYLHEKRIELRNVGIIVHVLPNQQFSMTKYLKQKCTDFGIQTGPLEKNDQREDHAELAIMDWDSACSLEWPLVIYILCMPLAYEKSDQIMYQRYRAMSRAVAKLVEINVTYASN